MIEFVETRQHVLLVRCAKTKEPRGGEKEKMEFGQDQLRLIDSMTKYPQIHTYHRLDPKTGLLHDDHVEFEGPVIFTEKINGTNARIIVFPDGDYIIGSRNELLHAKGDRIINPTLGIVNAVLDTAWRLCVINRYTCPIVFYGEVYGHGIEGGKAYTRTPGITGFRVFDIMTLLDFSDMLSWPLNKVASWREMEHQNFFTETALVNVCQEMELELVPRFEAIPAMIPDDHEGMVEFMAKHLRETGVALDDTGLGQAEGFVLRSSSRNIVAKARFEDYARTIRRRGKLHGTGH